MSQHNEFKRIRKPLRCEALPAWTARSLWWTLQHVMPSSLKESGSFLQFAPRIRCVSVRNRTLVMGATSVRWKERQFTRGSTREICGCGNLFRGILFRMLIEGRTYDVRSQRTLHKDSRLGLPILGLRYEHCCYFVRSDDSWKNLGQELRSRRSRQVHLERLKDGMVTKIN